MRILLISLFVYLFFSSSLAAEVPPAHQAELENHEHVSDEAAGRIDKVLERIKKLQGIMAKINEDTNHLYDMNTAQGKDIAKVQHSLEKLCGKLVDELLETIRTRGLHFGSRWKIVEETPNLVIRDMLSTERGSDARYMLSKGVKRDV